MDKQYNEVAARAVLAYLYDHDMYSLAEQFCMANPYLKVDQNALEKGFTPVSCMQKPLRDVLKEFIVMQSQLLQLVNLCSSVIEFPHANSAVVLADHLINVLKSSGTAEVMKAVVSTLPACTDWSMESSLSSPTPIPPNSGPNTTGSSQTVSEQSYSASDTLLGQDIIITASNVSIIESLTRCVSTVDSGMPIVVENAVLSGPSSAMKPVGLNGIHTGENVPPPSSYGKQSNVQLQTTSTPSIALHRNNQPIKPPQYVTLQQVREAELTSTSNKPLPSAADLPPIPTSGPKDTTTHKLPSSATASTIVTLTNGGTRSNATPLDNPILPGTVSSRSTSSRKRSHIRILDFGTPPFKRGSPSTVGRPSPMIPSPALLSVTTRAIPVVEKQPTTATSQGTVNLPAPPSLPPTLPPPPSAQNVKPKPKKVFIKRRIMRRGVRRQGKRVVGTKHCTQRLVARILPKNIASPSTNPQPTAAATDTIQPINLSTRSGHTSARKCSTITNLSTIKKLPPVFRPPSASPPRSGMPGSPACPIDPLALCPMTPRFLTRPLQPLSMLSPLLGTLDLSGISQMKSLSHSKPATDINTPGYPITPGNAITPSPPPEGSVSYYESEATSNDGTTVPPAKRASIDDEAYNSESDQHRWRDGDGSPGMAKPLLTLTTNSDEIAIRYDEKASLPVRVRDEQDEREHAARLAARIEIDDGNGKVFQIAVSPLMELYQHNP